MNDYIINPMWFYWVQLADSSKAILALIMVCAIPATIITGIIAGFFYLEEKADDAMPIPPCHSQETAKLWYDAFRAFAMVTIIAGILCLIIPSREILIEMKLAKSTCGNTEAIMQSIQNATDYIISTFNK